MRLTEQEAATIDFRNACRATEAAERAERDKDAAYGSWKAGRLRPYLITYALDRHGLYGPRVDVACGTEEPAADEWEAGVRYPTWPEFKALAALTLYPLGHFLRDANPIPFESTSMRFHLKPGMKPPPEPILCFEPEAIWAATRTPRCPWCCRGVQTVMPECLFCPHCGAAQMDGEAVRTVGGEGFAQCPDCGGRWPAETAAVPA
ncbi:hypothetical protein [Catenulispora acidiphila]|uniref:hypothetical protein n=1 Tax=Catenulispora acidiphila TaxID=304895 RepID=UPI00019E0177|nr:hypothetical protein [Catenulispora acidiphila]